jgi:hypothetical protein
MSRDAPYAWHFGRFLRLFPFLLTIIALAGCSSGVERAAHTQFQAPQFDDPGEQAGGLNVKLSSEAKDDATDNLKFNKSDLEATIRRALEINNLLAEQFDSGLPTIEVTVTSVRVRSSFSAIMFGFMAGDDHIDGNVVVRATDGNVLQKFSVSASYALGGLAGGQDSSRLSWLYETFAEHMTEELTGKSEVQLGSPQRSSSSEPALQSGGSSSEIGQAVDGVWKGQAVIRKFHCVSGPGRFDLAITVENGKIRGGDTDGIYSVRGNVSVDGRLEGATLNNYLLMQGSLASGVIRTVNHDCGGYYAMKKTDPS